MYFSDSLKSVNPTYYDAKDFVYLVMISFTDSIFSEVVLPILFDICHTAV